MGLLTSCAGGAARSHTGGAARSGEPGHCNKKQEEHNGGLLLAQVSVSPQPHGAGKKRVGEEVEMIVS